ncbi:MAG: hypothetical protein ACOX01_07640 [Methanobrevibacter boviskoreani]|jgi:hypothetical protein|uniref:hypothetical protein n=1 Tax=Methanobrevibacter boviskoreani TaxID=1348249 RepID=UPI0023A8A4E2|nr:hypothetical protein [Methanobrevibacter boviskoreani]MCI6774499.1 hypothetical protein [Methanobrevibacter boviskoreani]MCI6929665.1 hypothetical protein [Methanobrevibacter boviskoreani]MDY5614016.1 hypothetical protein [Methanobrevibacter boviskoreani]
MDDEIYFTLTALNMFHGVKPFRIGSIVKLVKDYGNTYDLEAIRAELRYAGPSAYVANSVKTVVKGTMSSGRLYDKILEEDYGVVKFIFDNVIICKLLTTGELDTEKSNPESDVNFI